MPNFQMRGLICLAIVSLVSLTGCSGDGKVSIDGTATWNGEPIQQGYIEFQPITDGQFASAEIVDGKFRVSTLPGKRLVRVTAQKQIGMTQPTDRIPESRPIMHQFIPAKFNSQSKKEIDISADDPKLEVALEGAEIKPQSGLSMDDKRRMNLSGGGRP
ncbi:hypothetical protein GC197_07630 [bacterium]|nr:hypothetical protein [bacterium]